jgi:hypothetical protein
MSPEINVRRFNKHVPVWSGRSKRPVMVEVDYQSIKAGDFTLIHIARLRDSAGHDTREQPARLRFAD